MNCLFGVDKRAGGEIRLNGKDISPRSPPGCREKKGMAYITESRRDNGFFPQLFYRSEHSYQPQSERRRL